MTLAPKLDWAVGRLLRLMDLTRGGLIQLGSRVLSRRRLARLFGATLFDWELQERRVAQRFGHPVTERVVEYPWILRQMPRTRVSVLDIGCCFSYLTHKLIAMGHKVFGIDALPFPQADPRLYAVRGDACAVPFRSGVFDVVTCVSTLEHIGLAWFGDPTHREGDGQCIDEMLRVVRPGGQVLITVPFGGRFKVTPSQRIYDSERLTDLLDKYQVISQEFFARCSRGWKLVEKEVAEKTGQGEDIEAVVAIRVQRKGPLGAEIVEARG